MELSGEHPGDAPKPYGRRAFIGIVAAGVSSLLWGDAALRGLSSLVSPVTQTLPSSLADALPSPDSGWRIYAVNPPMPVFAPATWRLRVDGLVHEPVELSYAQVRALPRVHQVSDFHCVTGWSVPGVRWSGVRLGDVLGAAGGTLPGAGALSFVSAERPYVDSLTLEQALAPDAMLALTMDGRPLSQQHGAPARMVIPRMYGYKGVKWLAQITAVRRPELGYWEQRGYDRDAWVGHSNSYQ